MELNMNVLESENFRSLQEDAQLLYIYATLKSEDGYVADLESYGEYLFIDVYGAMSVLEQHGLVRFNGEHDSIKIAKNPSITVA